MEHVCFPDIPVAVIEKKPVEMLKDRSLTPTKKRNVIKTNTYQYSTNRFGGSKSPDFNGTRSAAEKHNFSSKNVSPRYSNNSTP